MRWLAVALTRLYPATWRERYGEEFNALLEQCPARLGMVVNTAAGAIGAWMRWPALASASARLRGALTAVLWGGLVVLFIASGFVKAEIPATHPSVRAIGGALTWAAVVAAAAMAAGAAVPAVTVARIAKARRRTDVLRLIAAPPAAGLVFVGFVAAIATWARRTQMAAPLGHTLFYILAVVFLASAIVTGRAPSLALRRIDPGARALRVSIPFAVVAVAALAAATALMTAYTVSLTRYEPWLAHTGDGLPGWHLMLQTQLIISTVLMALGTLLAAVGLAQGTLGRHAKD